MTVFGQSDPRRLIAVAMLLWNAAALAACRPEIAMTDPSDRPEGFAAFESAVRQTLVWKHEAIEIGTSAELDRAGCRFYRASNPARADARPIDFAVLADGTIVAGRQQSTDFGRLLQSCGHDAPAEWWAQVVSRFARLNGTVVGADSGAGARHLRKAGVQAFLPELDRSGTTTQVVFYLYNFDLAKVFRVVGTLDARGTMTVETLPVTAEQAG